MTTPKAAENAAKKDPVLNEKQSNISEVKLSEGRIANCIKAKGKHVIEAQRLMDGKAELMMPALICVCTAIDGKKLLIEDFMEMPAEDCMTLMGHFGTAFQ